MLEFSKDYISLYIVKDMADFDLQHGCAKYRPQKPLNSSRTKMYNASRIWYPGFKQTVTNLQLSDLDR